MIFSKQRNEHTSNQIIPLQYTIKDQSITIDFPEIQKIKNKISDISTLFNKLFKKVSIVKVYQYTEVKVEEVVTYINEQYNKIYTRLDDQHDILIALNV